MKTYAHALKLHEERLQDAAKRKAELTHAIDQKRLTLLELKREQLAARKQPDMSLLEEIEKLREQIRAYKVPERSLADQAKDAAASGFVQLGKKTADGVVRIPVVEATRAPALMAQEGE